jgi:replication initiation protein RepC
MEQISKWKLLRAVEDAREPLGLKATPLNLLRALISFLPGDYLMPTPDGHICFAANETLADRAHVSVKTIERHVSALVENGLIKRHTGLNGKRWARRDGQGRVVLASGLSLAPLLQRHAEISNLAKAHAELVARLDHLKDQCRILLGQVRQVPELITRARNILRRKADEDALSNLLNELTDNLRDSDGDFEGHKEPHSNPVVLEDNAVEKAFPRLCAELRSDRTVAQCNTRMDSIAAEIGLGRSWTKARRAGHQAAFVLMGYVLQRIERLDHPAAYLSALTAKLEGGEITLNDLVKNRT